MPHGALCDAWYILYLFLFDVQCVSGCVHYIQSYHCVVSLSVILISFSIISVWSGKTSWDVTTTPSTTWSWRAAVDVLSSVHRGNPLVCRQQTQLIGMYVVVMRADDVGVWHCRCMTSNSHSCRTVSWWTNPCYAKLNMLFLTVVRPNIWEITQIKYKSMKLLMIDVSKL